MTKIKSKFFISCATACLGSSMLYGYNIAVFNGPKEHIQCFLSENLLNIVPCPAANSSQHSRPGDKHRIAFYYSMITTIWIIFGVAGAFCTGFFASNLGRRNSLLVNNLFIIFGSLITAPSVGLKMPQLLYIGRIFIGFHCGTTIGLAGIYLTELSPQNLRGAIGASHQLAVTIGILLAFLLSGLEGMLNRKHLWIMAQPLCIIPALISLIVLPWCPESPRYLYITCNDRKGAIEAIEQLYDEVDTEEVLKEMEDEKSNCPYQLDQDKDFKLSHFFKHSNLQMPIALAIGLQIMQQMSGINAVMSYSTTIMGSAGLSKACVNQVNIGLSLLNILCTLISLPLLEKFGRRPLLILPTAIAMISLLVMWAAVRAVEAHSWPASERLFSSLFIVFIFIYTGSIALGLGPIPGLLVSELFRQKPRSQAHSISQGVHWLSNLLVSTFYMHLQLAIGAHIFLIYLTIVLPLWLVLAIYLPETRDSSFNEIASYFEWEKRDPNTWLSLFKCPSVNELTKARRIEAEQEDKVQEFKIG